MRVLVACESSGTVREAFRAAGADAWSCDLLPPDDGSPYHFTADALATLTQGRWDLLIAHPPCQYLSASGLHWEKRRPERIAHREAATAFALALWSANVDRIALENPIGALTRALGRPTQIIQPYSYGHDASKRTCLWLKNLPPLSPAAFAPPRIPPGAPVDLFGAPLGAPRWSNQTDSGQNKLPPSADRWKERSRTYPGIAAAMAAAWSQLDCKPRRPAAGPLGA